MIRIAVMMDKNCVIGASSREEELKRFALMPRDLYVAMHELYRSDNIAAGASSWNILTKGAKKNRYVVTHNLDFDVQGENVQVITDADKLVKEYQNSEEELLIVGGFSIFKYFTPYTSQFDIAMSDILIPGDLVFDQWKKEPLSLIDTANWKGFKVLTYKRV